MNCLGLFVYRNVALFVKLNIISTHYIKGDAHKYGVLIRM